MLTKWSSKNWRTWWFLQKSNKRKRKSLKRRSLKNLRKSNCLEVRQFMVGMNMTYLLNLF